MLMLKYRLKRISKSKLIFWSAFLLIIMVSCASLVRFYAAGVTIEEHSSAIVGDTIYINDFEADWNYYESLNFTEITNVDVMPGQNIDINNLKYDKDTLVQTQIIYDGTDINNSNWVPYVSEKSGEQVSKFVYYKYYPIENGNIKIELIDNPYTARPKVNGKVKGFNGWVCDTNKESTVDCSDMLFTYDDQYYLRYVIVPANKVTTDADGNKKLVLNLRASWVETVVLNSYNTNTFNTFASGMTQYPTEQLLDRKLIYDYEYLFDPNYEYYEYVTVRTGEPVVGVTPNGFKVNTVCGAGVDGFVQGYGCSFYKLTEDEMRNKMKDYWYVTMSEITDEYLNVTDYVMDPDITYYELDEVANNESYYGLNYRGEETDNNGNRCRNNDPGRYNAGSFFRPNYRCRYFRETDDTTLDENKTYYFKEGENGDFDRNDNIVDFDTGNGLLPVYELNLDFDIYEKVEVNLNDNMDGVDIYGKFINEVCTSISAGYNSNTRKCTYYTLTDDVEPVEDKDYFIIKMDIIDIFIQGNYTLMESDVPGAKMLIDYNNGSSTVGLYYKVSYPGNNANLYYNSSGVRCDMSGANCRTGNDAFKLITPGEIIDGVDVSVIGFEVQDNVVINGEEYIRYNLVNRDVSKYYYLATRDTNIMYIHDGSVVTASNINNNSYKTREYTLSSAPGRGDVISAGFSVNGDLTIANDFVVEKMWKTEYHSYNVIRAEGHNVKIGRHSSVSVNDLDDYTQSTYRFSNGFIGGIQSSTTYKKARILIESGYYEYVKSLGTNTCSNDTNIQLVIGSDFDRINSSTGYGDNQYLTIAYRLTAADDDGNHNDNNKTNIPTSDITVKSGRIGTDVLDSDTSTINRNFTVGIYSGSLGGATGNSLRRLKIEGGDIACVNGGPGTSNERRIQTATYMTGGRVINIVGGAGQSPAEGSRVVSVSGGIVRNAVAGGSNSSSGSQDGRIFGSTVVYIGGNAQLGGDTNYSNLFGVQTEGTVFAAGLGRNNNDLPGSVISSHLIINGGTIYGDAFGGGNYGSAGLTGEDSDKNSSTVIDIYNGDIRGSVYGGANSQDSGSEYNNYSVTINMFNGNIAGSLYGGANTTGTVNGSVDINLYGGNITNSVYGGGYGNSTRINKGIDITSDASNNLLNISNIYGGSSLGSVNNNSGNTVVTINGGTIGTVYGGGEGNNNTAPISYNNVTVNISNGIIGTVYGGTNVNGTLPRDNNDSMTVSVTGGTIGTVYGGSNGEKTISRRTNVDINCPIPSGSEVPSCSIANVYGGGNASTTETDTTNVIVTQGLITDSLYGGGNASPADNTSISVKGGIINYIYGGGNGRSAVVESSKVDVTGGTIASRLYGGGKLASTTTTDVDVSDGYFYDTIHHEQLNLNEDYAEIFGGGAEAAVDNTNVEVKGSAKVYNVYGGSETSGYVEKTNVVMTNGNVACNVYGGGKIATTGESNVHLNGSSFIDLTNHDDTGYSTVCGNAFGGGAEADVTTSKITLNGSKLINVYGGSNRNGIVGNSNVNINNGEVHNVFGGNNVNGSTGNTNVVVDKTENKNLTIYNDVFAGGNGIGSNTPSDNASKAQVTGNTYVSIENAVISGSVFGGGNEAKVLGNTRVDFLSGTSYRVYGGGNKSFVGNAVTAANGEYVSSNGNPGSTHVNVVSGTILDNVYGSGNSSFVYGNTNVNIGDSAIAITNYSAADKSLIINGSVFGGSETNSDEKTTWEYSSKGVVGDVVIDVDADSYIVNNRSNLSIVKSIYGSGNNSATDGVSKVYINKLGTDENPSSMTSIQRANYVYLTDSFVEMNGDRDRALATQYKYGLMRIDYFYLLGSQAGNGSTLYMRNGATFLKRYYSGMFNGNSFDNDDFVPQTVSSSTTSGVTTNSNSTNNKLYVYTNVIFAVSDSEKPSYESGITNAGPIKGMTYYGMYNHPVGDRYHLGIYDTDLKQGDTVSNDIKNDVSSLAYTFVYGKHEQEPEIQIVTNGFYTNSLVYDEETEEEKIIVDYVGVTPLNSTYYKWVIGDEPTDIVVDLEATKYSVEGAVNETITLNELKELVGGQMVEWHDAILTIKAVDTSSFGVTEADATVAYGTYLVDKSQIKVVNVDDERKTEGTSVVDANQLFGLSMGTTSSGWLDKYKTNFYSTGESVGDNFCVENSNGECTGDSVYLYDSTTVPRSLSFWLYHSKNLDFSYGYCEDEEVCIIPMGTVYIHTEFRNPNGDPNNAANIQNVRIVVNLSMRTGEDDAYGKAISPGKKYEVFDSKKTSITTNGSFSIYQSLSLDLTKKMSGTNEDWDVTKLYSTAFVDNNGDSHSAAYRYLASDYAFPVGTKITMLDLKNGEQYYYDVTESNYSDKAADVRNNHVTRYYLTDFIKMGTTTGSSNNYFDDDMKDEYSTKYYTESGDIKIAVEEFIFTVDFANVDESDMVNNVDTNYLYMQISKDVNGVEKPILLPTGIPDQEMQYTLNPGVISALHTTGGFVADDGVTLTPSTTLYVGEKTALQLHTNLMTGDNVNSNIADTIYEDYKLGAKLTIWVPSIDNDGNEKKDENGNVIYEQMTNDLFGTVVTINGKDYYPQTDGSIRIELAGLMTDVVSYIQLDFENSSLVYGDYKLVVETFASYDGLYYGNYTPNRNEFPFVLLNSQYGIDVTVPPVEITHDVSTGLDANGSNKVTYTVNTINGLANPNLKVSLQRRTYNGYYDTTYENIDLKNLAISMNKQDDDTNLLETCYTNIDDGSPCYIYSLGAIERNLNEVKYQYILTLKEGPTDSELIDKVNSTWKSGTYRVVFTMYDGDEEIGSVYEYLIIRSLDVDE